MDMLLIRTRSYARRFLIARRLQVHVCYIRYAAQGTAVYRCAVNHIGHIKESVLYFTGRFSYLHIQVR